MPSARNRFLSLFGSKIFKHLIEAIGWYTIWKFDHELSMRLILIFFILHFLSASSPVQMFPSFLLPSIRSDDRDLTQSLRAFSISVQILEEAVNYHLLVLLLLLTIFNQCSLQFMSNYGVIHIRIAYRLPFAMFDGKEEKFSDERSRHEHF